MDLKVKYGMRVNILRKIITRATAAALAVFIFALSLIFVGCSSYIRYPVRFFIVGKETENSYQSEQLTQNYILYGGAGYLLNCQDKNLAVAACYFNKGEALDFAALYNSIGVEAEVITVERVHFPLTTYYSQNNSRLFEKNISNLYLAARQLGSCSAALQSSFGADVRGVLKEVYSLLTEMLSENAANCFTSPLSRLISLCGDICFSAVVLPREIKYVQAAVVDVILNITLC